MKNLLYFFFGFFVVTAIALNCYAMQPGLNYCSETSKCFYLQVIVEDYNPGYTGCGTITYVNYLLNSEYCAVPQSQSFTGCGAYRLTFRRSWWRKDSIFPLGTWEQVSDITGYVKKGDLISLNDNNDPVNIAFPDGPPSSCGVPTNCPDTDNDGVCDTCDDDPQNSSVGRDVYLKARYVYNGKSVAILTTGSPSSTNNYSQINYLDVHFPGYIIGGTGGIDEQTFVQGGGTFQALENPEKMYTKGCEQASSPDQCENVPCTYDETDSGKDTIENPEEGEIYTPAIGEKGEEIGLIDPDKTEPERQADCGKICGGTDQVSTFAYTSGSYACVCKSGGKAELAGNYDNLGDLDTNGSDLSPDSATIEAEGTTIGSGSVGIGGLSGSTSDSDQDGDIDGYQMGDRNINFAPLITGTSKLAEKFPFSLISYLSDLSEQLNATPQTPSFDLTIWNQTLHFDLSMFDSIASVSRSLFAFLLTAMCFWGVVKLFT